MKRFSQANPTSSSIPSDQRQCAVTDSERTTTRGIIAIALCVALFLFSSAVGASTSTGDSNSIKVLIVNDTYPNIPGKNEQIEKLGTMQGELLVMGSHYAGTIDVWRGENGLYIVNELPLEEYIRDVVAAEVNPEWDMEALKAQAVVSRTYALYQKSQNGNSLYHLASSVINQVYKGKNSDSRVAYAVLSTAGEVLTYDGKIIEALYHSTCGGKTEKPEEVFGKSSPYLTSVESTCDLSPYAVWERTIGLEEIEKALKMTGIQGITVVSYTATNRVKQLSIATKDDTVTINATDFRKALGWSRLPSTNFSMNRIGDEIIFSGKGYGHGVGLCQWCALKMAREGKTYREILSFFYPGTSIQIYGNP